MLLNEDPEMDIDQETEELARRKMGYRRLGKTPARALSKGGGQARGSEEGPGSEEWSMVSELTAEEKQMIAKKREKVAKGKAKKVESRALTGSLADYPSLSTMHSNEVAINMVFVMAARMRTFLWKKMLWQLRVKKAVEAMPQARWKRNPRWLAGLLSREVGWLWGHYGAMRQRLSAPEVWSLF